MNPDEMKAAIFAYHQTERLGKFEDAAKMWRAPLQFSLDARHPRIALRGLLRSESGRVVHFEFGGFLR